VRAKPVPEWVPVACDESLQPGSVKDMSHMSHTPTPSASSLPEGPRKLVNARSVARVLGVSPQWVYRAAQDERIPHARLGDFEGAPVRFDLDEVESWVESCRRAWRPGFNPANEAA
jgi:excisionase family DNA binding protein